MSLNMNKCILLIVVFVSRAILKFKFTTVPIPIQYKQTRLLYGVPVVTFLILFSYFFRVFLSYGSLELFLTRFNLFARGSVVSHYCQVFQQ